MRIEKALDVVLPPARTEKEDWDRFLNRMETQLRQRPYAHRVRIEINRGEGTTEPPYVNLDRPRKSESPISTVKVQTSEGSEG